MCALPPESGHLQCTGPRPLWANSGHSGSIDYLVGAAEQRRGYGETEHPGGLRIMTSSNLLDCTIGNSAGLFTMTL